MVAPVLPQKANPLKWNIKVDVLQNEFPEFSSYKDVLFEVDKQLQKTDNVFGKTDWENVVLDKTETKGLYSLRFSKGTLQVNYFVKPVFFGKSYTVAMQKYNSAFAQYKMALKNRLDKEAKQKEEYEVERKKALDEYRKSALKEIRTDAVMRSFTIQNFGIWNCDRVILFNTNCFQVYPKFTINNNKTDKKIFFVDESLNAVIKIAQNQKLHINTESKKILWAVTVDFKVAVFTSEQFDSIPKGTTRYTFNLTELPVKIEKPEDFIALYNNGFK